MDDRAFILFSVGPVQQFISAARTLRDLWTGSFLLAWLTRQAMTPIYEKFGAQAFIEPDMERDPMEPRQLADKLRSPCLPNRFLAEIPATEAEFLAEECRKSFENAWRNIAGRVRQALSDKIGEVFARPGNNGDDWPAEWQQSVERLWDAQVDSFFDVRITVVPWRDCTPQTVAALMGEREDSQGQQQGQLTNTSEKDRLWTERANLAAKIHAAHKTIRKVTTYHPKPNEYGRFPAKCTLLGTYEYLGPTELAQAALFWQDVREKVSLQGTRFRSGERLSAISLVKRFAWPAYFTRELPNADPRILRFEDTATTAAAQWLREEPALNPNEVRKKHDVWSGRWLHWERPDQDEDEERCPDDIWRTICQKRRVHGGPPSYYAVLVMDGDRMGQHLRLRWGPEYRRSISRALMSFALDEAPNIVESHLGVLVYCGGDDLLALLPTVTVISCAQELNATFRRVWRQKVLHGEQLPEATMSAGVAVVHIKEDLRFALETARNAEKLAKSNGRDLLALTLCRRSGEHSTTLCPWPFLPVVNELIRAFTPTRQSKTGASDRWARHVYQELSTLEALPLEAMKAELRRHLNRAEDQTRKLLSPGAPDQAGDVMVERFEEFRACRLGRLHKGPGGPVEDPRWDAQVMKDFLNLCQAASFLARRREE